MPSVEEHEERPGREQDEYRQAAKVTETHPGQEGNEARSSRVQENVSGAHQTRLDGLDTVLSAEIVAQVRALEMVGEVVEQVVRCVGHEEAERHERPQEQI